VKYVANIFGKYLWQTCLADIFGKSCIGTAQNEATAGATELSRRFWMFLVFN